MSWLTDIAGRAEQLLNKIDQNTASVINETTKGRRRSSAASSSSEIGQQQQQQLNEVLTTSSTSSTSSNDGGAGGSPNHRQQQQGSSSTFQQNSSPTRSSKATDKVVSRDDTLIQFLNSSGNDEEDFALNGQSDKSEHLPSTAAGGGKTQHTLPVDRTASPVSFLERASAFRKEERQQKAATKTVTNGSLNGNSTLTSQSENELLRNELSSLNQEMSQVLQRAKTAEKALSEVRLEAANRERELVRTLAQNPVKQLQLEEQLKSLQDEVKELREGEKVAEEKRERLQEQLAKEKKEQEEIMSTMKTKEQATAETVRALESERSRFQTSSESAAAEKAELQRKLDSLAESAVLVRRDLEQSREQHEEYKTKAKMVLREKEKFIVSLRENIDGKGRGGGDEEDFDNAELQQAIRERNLLRDETSQLSDELSAAKHELSVTEKQFTDQTELTAKFQREAANALGEARVKWEESEKEADRLREDLRYLQDDSSRQKSSYIAALNERDEVTTHLAAELSTCKDKLSSAVARAGSAASGSPEETEKRLGQLTASLLQKQALLEAISAEKTSLVLKMERMESEHRNVNGGVNFRSASSHAKGGLDEYSVVGRGGNPEDRTPRFMMESPFDNHVAKGVKRAYLSVDKIAWIFTNMLRRNSMARIFILAYMSLLHFWVFLILFQAAPDPTR